MMKLKPITRYLATSGLILGAIALEVEKLDAVPEFMRPWYSQDPVSKSFKLDIAKVEVEDVAGLKNTVKATREEARLAREQADKRVQEALKQFEGIDPVKTRELLSRFASEEEKEMIAKGNIDQVIEKRMEKQREELLRQVETSATERDGALEVASTFMERVLDNAIFAAATQIGIQPSAIEDALLRARQIFSLSDEGEAVQFEEDGETIVLGKDGKTPYSPTEWLEEMREKAPHWFPAGATGGGAHGDRGFRKGQDLSGMSPQERLTAAREQKAGKR